MNKLINKIQSLLPSGLSDTKVDQQEEISFIIRYDKLDVGKLRLHSGEWSFQYTGAFKQQDELQPLKEFPDVTKTYESDELWPFFLIRIPSLKQPKIQKIIQKEDLDATSQVALLKRFGEKSIANPFRMETVG